MKKTSTIFKLICAFFGMVLMTLPMSAQEWDNTNPMDELPVNAPWRSRDAVLDFSSIIADPDIEGNNLLFINDFSGIYQRGSFRYDWLLQDANGTPADEVNEKTGITIVFRAKPSQQATEIDTAIRMYVSIRASGATSPQTDIVWKKDTLRLVGFDAFPVPGENIDYPMVNDTDWHIFRVTVLGKDVNVYLDEDPTPVISGQTFGADPGADHLRIGKQDRNKQYGGSFDYFLIKEGFIWAPGEGAPIPAGYEGSTISSIKPMIDNSVSDIVCFPNPAHDYMRILFNQKIAGETKVEIFDLLGRKISTPFEGILNQDTQELEIYTGDLSPQTYLVKVNGEVTKFIKE